MSILCGMKFDLILPRVVKYILKVIGWDERSSDFPRLATYSYTGIVFLFQNQSSVRLHFVSYFQIIWLTFQLLPLHCLGGFDRWSRRNKRHLSMRKGLLGGLLINLFIPAPNPAIDWIFWTPTAWHFDFTSDSPCLIVYLQWSSWSIIILSFIMPKVAQWSLIVISRSNQPIDAPPSSIENLFSWHDLSKMIDLLIPVLTRDNVLSSYKTTFDWLHLDQSRLANQMYNNLPIASCCTVDIPCST